LNFNGSFQVAAIHFTDRNDRCWPNREAQQAYLGVSFGEIGFTSTAAASFKISVEFFAFI